MYNLTGLLCCPIILLLIFITAVKSDYKSLHQKLHISVGPSFSNLRDYEIIFPEFLDEATIRQFHATNKRARRNVERNRKYLKLRSAGTEFLVELQPNKRFIDSTFFVMKIKANNNHNLEEEVVDTKPNNECNFFTGRIISHKQRPAAISLCNGLSALLRTDYDDYIVEPVHQSTNNESDISVYPHIIYKRKDILKQNASYFGNSGNGDIRKLANSWEILQNDIFNYNFYRKSAAEHDRKSSLKDQIEQTKKGTYELPDYDWTQPTTTGRNRVKRSDKSSTQGTVETLVIVDRFMLEKHRSQHRTDVASYVLTVMNMVNALFHDSTLNMQLDISLVGLILMEDDEELNLGHDAQKSLTNFCQWQAERSFPSRKKPDHAILLTGRDICIDRDEPCDTLGLAGIGGMCIFNESCSISEDSGLGLAFTVAHEIGHSLGMVHDGEGNDCSSTGGYIMSPSINSMNGVFTWSSCSRKALKEFFEKNRTNCLMKSDLNHPGFGIDPVRELPGQIYSPDNQCKLQFGVNHSICASRYVGNKSYICKILWCRSSTGNCETKHLPASEGSSCGENLWCRRGECVSLGSEGPAPIHGDWSDFGPWTECSRTCNVGVKMRKRKCDNPSPKYGGKHCDGKEVLYELCNTFECPSTVTSFRGEQCAEYNSKPHRQKYFNWVAPKDKFWKNAADPCQLLCEAEGFGFSMILAPKVKDGTRCNNYNNDVCIDGKCEHVGCDYKLHSNATSDKCGVCNGDNSTCRLVNGTFAEPVYDSDYYFVTTIPRGATTIRIWERNHDPSVHAYIAVKSALRQSYYLNGNWELDMNGGAFFADCKWKYSRKYSEPEELVTDGPIDEDLIIEVLILHRNPGISYSYYLSDIDNALPHDVSTKLQQTKSIYSWHQYITSCTKSCAGGHHYTKVTCLENDEAIVNETLCANLTKPTPTKYYCNTQPCPAEWITSDWSQCSATCGVGIQIRPVICKQDRFESIVRLSSDRCDNNTKPYESRPCNVTNCALWNLGRWSKCSKTCDKGQRSRKAICMQGDIVVKDKMCGKRPRTQRGCRVAKCRPQYRWLVTAWSKCSRSCGLGVQKRKVRCGRKTTLGGFKSVKRKRCFHLIKPKISTRKRCLSRECYSFQGESLKNRKVKDILAADPSSISSVAATSPTWVKGKWSQCSASCGNGKMHRVVKCVIKNSESNSCLEGKKPTDVRNCNTQPCHTVTVCEDQFSWCGLVSYHHACGDPYFGKSCCKSCSQSNANDD